MARDEAASGSQEADNAGNEQDAQEAVVLSIDAMGGDLGPTAVVDGLAEALKQPAAADLRFLLHGPEAALRPLLVKRPTLSTRVELRDCEATVAMGDRPTDALRRGRESSMWRCLDSVASGEAAAAVSLGNTGALMAMSMVRLRLAPGIGRSAIAAHWPSQNPAGFNVVLDMGADIRAEARNLFDYALMGAEYARLTLDVEKPRVALLNIGAEDAKGRPEIAEAADRLKDAADQDDAGFSYVGFIEGDKIASSAADVIVTDGFTGNVALKTAEGTARLIGGFLRQAFQDSWRGRIAALFAYGPLRAFKLRIDPRRVNGGVFLGLNGVVVKSHGAADGVGVASAVALAARLGRERIAVRIVRQVAKLASDQDDPQIES
ncbi:MAG: phosphate acyltransferase PlsX [Pseudomonadota bacterium]